jgi:hypothetical protein
MLYDHLSDLEVYRITNQILSSIRETNRRLDELKWVVKEGLCDGPMGLRAIAKRIERLSETRMKLIYSVSDLRRRINRSIGKEEHLGIKDIYKELKDL